MESISAEQLGASLAHRSELAGPLLAWSVSTWTSDQLAEAAARSPTSWTPAGNGDSVDELASWYALAEQQRLINLAALAELEARDGSRTTRAEVLERALQSMLGGEQDDNPRAGWARATMHGDGASTVAHALMFWAEEAVRGGADGPIEQSAGWIRRAMRLLHAEQSGAHVDGMDPVARAYLQDSLRHAMGATVTSWPDVSLSERTEARAHVLGHTLDVATKAMQRWVREGWGDADLATIARLWAVAPPWGPPHARIGAEHEMRHKAATSATPWPLLLLTPDLAQQRHWWTDGPPPAPHNSLGLTLFADHGTIPHAWGGVTIPGTVRGSVHVGPNQVLEVHDDPAHPDFGLLAAHANAVSAEATDDVPYQSRLRDRLLSHGFLVIARFDHRSMPDESRWRVPQEVILLDPARAKLRLVAESFNHAAGSDGMM